MMSLSSRVIDAHHLDVNARLLARPALGDLLPAHLRVIVPESDAGHAVLQQLLQVVCAYRLFMPFASITVSTRECARVRDNLVNIAATKISAGVSTGIGSHVDDIEDKGDDQFEISDERSVDEVYDALLKNNLQPVMSDYIYV